jgi:hypothetical protein
MCQRYLAFWPGAMPKLQRLDLANRSCGNGVAPAGLEHLLALEEFFVFMFRVEESDKTSIVSAP